MGKKHCVAKVHVDAARRLHRTHSVYGRNPYTTQALMNSAPFHMFPRVASLLAKSGVRFPRRRPQPRQPTDALSSHPSATPESNLLRAATGRSLLRFPRLEKIPQPGSPQVPQDQRPSLDLPRSRGGSTGKRLAMFPLGVR